MPFTLPQINALPRDEFVRVVGPIFEHSPWIAERGESDRPFASRAALHEALCAIVRRAVPDKQLALIRAHPDLVGRAVLTAESRGEQAAAGLSDLSAEEVVQFDRSNREYKERFGFPFIICARLHNKAAILAAFPERLRHTPDEERAIALAEIFKIAELRLADLIPA